MISTEPAVITHPLLLPESIWQHDLFHDGADFPVAATPLAVELCDLHLRKLLNMPSTDDRTPVRILQQVGRVYRWSQDWIARHPLDASEIQSRMSRIGRLTRMLSSGVSDEMSSRLMAGLSDLIPERLRSFVPAPTLQRIAMLERLHALELILLDDFMSHHEPIRHAYLKKVFRAVADGLTANSTTDSIRIRPVLDWIAQLLRARRRTDCAYVDVGCGMAGGAPGLQLAAERLRENGPCSVIHGTDLAAPPRALVREMLARHILLYRSNAVERPLPRKYDVILLANVHRHLNRPLQHRMLTHLGQSLNESGLLIVNWRFSSQSSPALCLERHNQTLVLMSEQNCVG